MAPADPRAQAGRTAHRRGPTCAGGAVRSACVPTGGGPSRRKTGLERASRSVRLASGASGTAEERLAPHLDPHEAPRADRRLVALRLLVRCDRHDGRDGAVPDDRQAHARGPAYDDVKGGEVGEGAEGGQTATGHQMFARVGLSLIHI